MNSISLSINKESAVPVNLFVVLLFVFVNPIYVLFFCAFLNLINTKINFWIFSFMFALSFSLFFYLKDYGSIASNSDLYWHINTFKTLDNLSWSEIILRFIRSPHANEPFFWIYAKLIMTFISSNVSFFVFFHYFITFVLIAYLGKIVNANKFVIIILCVLFTNFGVLFNLYQVWRHTFSFLMLMIGIFSFDARKKNLLPRFFIYSSWLFHLSSAPLIIFFEIFAFFTQKNHKYELRKLFSMKIIGYVILVVLIFTLLTKFGLAIGQTFGIYNEIYRYYLTIMPTGIGYNALFNSFTYAICLFLWLRRKNLTTADVFIASQYFIFTILINELEMPDVFSRYSYYIMFGGSILIGKMVTANLRLGFIFLIILFIYDVYIINYSSEAIQTLSKILYSDYNNPDYGLGAMILNYDNILNFVF